MKIKDPLYGLIVFPKEVQELIESVEFCSLYECHQLGATHLVYPGANHTRAEHSIGVGYLASKVAEHLKLSPDYTLCLLIAALLHDIGHKPFSHLYEKAFSKYNHETEGVEIAKRLLKGKLPDKNIELVGCMIIGKECKGFPKYLTQIIHNESLDIDELDYIARDSLHTLGQRLDFSYILNSFMIHNDEIVFDPKASSSISEMWSKRMYLFQQVYIEPNNLLVHFKILEVMKRKWSVERESEVLDPTLISELKKREFKVDKEEFNAFRKDAYYSYHKNVSIPFLYQGKLKWCENTQKELKEFYDSVVLGIEM